MTRRVCGWWWGCFHIIFKARHPKGWVSEDCLLYEHMCAQFHIHTRMHFSFLRHHLQEAIWIMRGLTETGRDPRPWASCTTETPHSARHPHWQIKPESCHQILLPGSPNATMSRETKEVETQERSPMCFFEQSADCTEGQHRHRQRRTFSWQDSISKLGTTSENLSLVPYGI